MAIEINSNLIDAYDTSGTSPTESINILNAETESTVSKVNPHSDEKDRCDNVEELPVIEQVQRTLWQELERVLFSHYFNPDLQGIKAASAAIAAHRLDGQPVWAMLVAPPGSFKTDFIQSLDGLPNVHLIDSLTPKTFLSGQMEVSQKSVTSPSLLHRVGRDAIIGYPDFGTILSMKTDDRALILADMRKIYDGRLHKEFGTADSTEHRDWKGRITFIVGATEQVDKEYMVFQSMGERFVVIRLFRPSGPQAAKKAMNQNRTLATESLKTAVHNLLSRLPTIQPILPEEFQDTIAAWAEFVAIARTHVTRDSRNKQITFVPEPEAPTRIAQQFAQLAKGAALLAGRETVSEDEWELVRRVGWDCLPKNKKLVLNSHIVRRSPLIPPKLPIPATTASYVRGDLVALGLFKTPIAKDQYELSPMALDLLEKAGALGNTT